MLASQPARTLVMATPLLTILLLGACSGPLPPTAPSLVPAGTSLVDSSARALPAAAASIDIGGTWEWRQTTLIQARPFVAAAIFQIAPEGPMTHIRCESNGELTLQQTGSAFAGSATQSSVCRTQGGVVFNPFPPTLQVENGRVLGHSFRFDFTSGGIPCPQTGGIRVRDVQAVELHGTGDCELPDEHPLLGSYKDIHFVATR